MKNKVVKPSLSPGNIIYVNDVPYLLLPQSLPEKIGEKGERIGFASYVNMSPDSYVKLSDGKVLLRYKDNPYFHKVILDNVKGVIGDAYDLVIFTDKNFFHFTNGLLFSNSYEEKSTILKDNISECYPIDTDSRGIIKTKDGKLCYVYYDARSPSLGSDILPGSELKFYKRLKGHKKTFFGTVLLTDKGLHAIIRTDTKGLKFLNEPGMPLSDEDELYSIQLPEKVNIEDIKDVEGVVRYNLFLLTKQGDVYAIGDNRFYQRGIDRDIDVGKWNKIRYPEPIKQIFVTVKPRVFALSESGNLYYHGYNEDNGFRLFSHNRNIESPTKIDEGILHIFSFNQLVDLGADSTIHGLDNEGNYFCYPAKYSPLEHYKVLGKRRTVPPPVIKSVTDLFITNKMVHMLVDSACAAPDSVFL